MLKRIATTALRTKGLWANLAHYRPLHGYGIARRIEQVSKEALQVNQGTIYLCLVRLVQKKWIKAEWGISENNRKARFYSISKAGQKQLIAETENWQRVAGTIARLLQWKGEE
jgi:transcriptional regulator